MASKKERACDIYAKAINAIDDITEYREPRPKWLSDILTSMHSALKKLQEEKDA